MDGISSIHRVSGFFVDFSLGQRGLPRSTSNPLKYATTMGASCSLINNMHQNIYRKIIKSILLNKLIQIILFLYLI